MMMKTWFKLLSALFLFFASLSMTFADGVKGIYLTQYTLENTTFLNYLIKHAKASGIDTFVVDLELPSKRYRENIALVKQNGIRYVARIIMFPGGGTSAQIKNPEQWQKKYSLVKQAIDWGADEIQLDYIRYSSKQKPSPENAKDIYKIIQWYKNKVAAQNIPLQIDVFGIASYGESKYIGQNIKMFADTVDAICPMVYPSHYQPFAKHYATPYETVYDSLTSIKKQFDDKMPIKMYAYIELSNYHYRMTREQRIKYIEAQLRAVSSAGANGWYAWSPHNRYEHLFSVLQGKKVEAADKSVEGNNDADDDNKKADKKVVADKNTASGADNKADDKADSSSDNETSTKVSDKTNSKAEDDKETDNKSAAKISAHKPHGGVSSLLSSWFHHG
jgi:hypothetical protein